MIEVFLIFLPAYIANAFPVVLGGSLPLDEILSARIFGKNKTLLGLISGFSVGVLTSYVVAPYTSLPFREAFFLGVLTTVGALVGDLAGSYLKRRVGIKEGGESLFFDSLLFILVAVAFVFLADRDLLPPLYTLAFILFTLAIHRSANVLAHRVGLKKVPW